LFGRQTFIEDVVRVLDLPAPGAGQIATEERLQHKDQGISLHPFEFLGEDIAGNRIHLRKRDSHDELQTLEIRTVTTASRGWAN
jgi:hypothetical protein